MTGIRRRPRPARACVETGVVGGTTVRGAETFVKRWDRGLAFPLERPACHTRSFIPNPACPPRYRRTSCCDASSPHANRRTSGSLQ
jgi:hypothetical protein